MPQLDVNTYLPQVVWLVITFAALFLIMWRVAVPRIADVLEARQKRIDDNLDKAAETKKEAEEALEAYEKALAEAREEARSVVTETQHKIAQEAAEREAALADELSQMIADGEADIRAAVEAAMKTVGDAAQEVAATALERLTGKRAGDKDVARAVARAQKEESR